MNSWIEGLQSALEYIEANLTNEIDIRCAAGKAYVSEFYFQRIFTVMCGYSVGEYIRCRRLTLAAQELSNGNPRVIDVAMKYGYDSPDSFGRAFTKFHGVPPSAAKERGAMLKSFAPIKIKLSLEGGNMLEYKIVRKEAFTVVGLLRKFNTDTSYKEIPEFWSESMSNECKCPVCGMYGICLDSDGKNFDYMIADNYMPQKDIADGLTARTIPAGTWAVFPCRGEWTKTIQAVNTAIWSEWLPNMKEYKICGNYNVEMYDMPAERPEDNYAEIWIPIEKA